MGMGKIKVMLILLILVTLRSISATICNACLDDHCYAKAKIFGGYIINGQIALDRKNDILYFTYIDSKGNKNAIIDLNRKEFINNTLVDIGFARTVDQDTGDVYTAGATGVFKHSPDTNATEKVMDVTDKPIYRLQFNNKLYYSVYPEEGLYVFEKGESDLIAALSQYKISDFVIDRYENVYFVHNLNTYKLGNGTDIAIPIATKKNLALDLNGNAYIMDSTTKTLYKVDYSDKAVKFRDIGVFESGSPIQILFDKFNNIIYHTVDGSGIGEINALTVNYANCAVLPMGILVNPRTY